VLLDEADIFLEKRTGAGGWVGVCVRARVWVCVRVRVCLGVFMCRIKCARVPEKENLSTQSTT